MERFSGPMYGELAYLRLSGPHVYHCTLKLVDIPEI